MKKLKFKDSIVISFLLFLILTGCYHFDFVNQPSTADPNSSFDVQISVNMDLLSPYNGLGYFGVMLPNGWTISDSVLYTIPATNDTGFIEFSNSLSQQMSSIDPPPNNYYWWVGQDHFYADTNDTQFILDLKIFTNDQTGNFFLDYMLGDDENEINYIRSDDHLIIIGDVVGCFLEGITFASQAEIDNFQTNYPDCSEIAGNVTITGNNITNLDGLDNLTSIGGRLWINDNDSLSVLGLANLTSVGGTLSISKNINLTSLTGLNNLTSIGQDMLLSNIELTNLMGLESLITIGGDLEIENYSLSSMSGLGNLTSVGGDFWIYSDLLVNFTGLEGITSIGGNLIISGNSSLTSFTGMETLDSIGGEFRIQNNAALTSLTGLEELTSIGGGFQIQTNPALTSLTSLGNLNSVGGNLTITNNSSLSSCDAEFICEYLSNPNGAIQIYNNAPGCNSMTKLAYDCGTTMPCQTVDNYLFRSQDDIDYFPLVFTSCDTLNVGVTISGSDITNLNGLSILSSIGGDLTIYNNISLQSFAGLDNLTSIGGNFSIAGNDLIISFSGLNNLTFIGGALRITGNNALTTLIGLGDLTFVGGYLMIGNNDVLTTLTGLDNISTNAITDLYITRNASLSTCEAQWLCDYLANPNGVVTIYNNASGCNNLPEIANACGITLPCLPYGDYYFSTQSEIDNFSLNYNNCKELEGSVIISGNDITNLNGLNVVTSISGGLSIGSNADLTSLAGLDNLTSIGGNFSIAGNDLIISFSGLNNLTFIGGGLKIGNEDWGGAGNPSLTSLSGLNNVTSIGGELLIANNNALTNLTGLESITSIGGEISIKYNNALTNLTGLDNIDAGSISGLRIQLNSYLSTCEVQSICDYLASPSGSISINSNNPGCNSQEEVEVACQTVSVDEITYSETLKIHPNPFHTSTTIEYELNQRGTIRITIYNQFGAQVETVEQNKPQGLNRFVWTPTNLPNGIYYFTLQAGEHIATGKMILMR